MASKIKKMKRPTIGQMVKATAPRFHGPTQVHEVPKRKLIEKAIRRAEREER